MRLSIFSHSPHSCRGYLSVTEAAPLFVVSAGVASPAWGTAALLGSLQQDTSSPSNISSAHMFPLPPQAAVNIKISMCHKVRYVSLHFSSLRKSRRKQKRKKKQSRNKRGVSRWELKRDRKSIRQCVWAPHQGLKITLRFLFFGFVFFYLPLCHQRLPIRVVKL